MAIFTLVHVLISLVGIVTGFVVVGAMLCGRNLPGWTATFLATTIATSATGFGFPFVKFLPAHGLAIISLILLPIAVYAIYAQKLAGKWQIIYITTALVALYLNVVVLIVQTFLKFPVLHELAPQQNEPPFVITQLLTLVAFLYIGFAASKRFKPEVVAV